MNKNYWRAARFVFFCGVMLRVILALVNYAANDRHTNIIQIMAYENRIPENHEDREAFQPKLYHGTVAAILKALPFRSNWLVVHVGQLVSCLAGILTLALAYRFVLREIAVSETVRLISFTLLALNPVLIGINAQATNDSFVILFVSLAFYFGWHFFQTHRTVDFCWMSLFALLAGLSKANGLVIFIAVSAVFAIAVCGAHDSRIRINATMYGLVFLASYLILVPTLGPYWKNYREYGSGFATSADPPVSTNKQITDANVEPGTANKDSLFTFQLGDMLGKPYRVNGWKGDSSESLALYRGAFPLHQSSAWSQLYARTHFVHFDGWPPSWQVPINSWPYGTWARALVFNIGRLILLVALFPTVLLLTGVLRSLVSGAHSLIIAKPAEHPLSDWLVDFTAVGYILFLAALFLKYGYANWFKGIYIFPGFLAFLVLFARECERFYAWCSDKKILRISANTVFLVLLLLYVMDVATLIGQLSIGVAYTLYKTYSQGAVLTMLAQGFGI